MGHSAVNAASSWRKKQDNTGQFANRIFPNCRRGRRIEAAHPPTLGSVVLRRSTQPRCRQISCSSRNSSQTLVSTKSIGLPTTPLPFFVGRGM